MGCSQIVYQVVPRYDSAYSTFELNIHHAITVLILRNIDYTSSLPADFFAKPNLSTSRTLEITHVQDYGSSLR